jgi:hypothetical protein
MIMVVNNPQSTDHPALLRLGFIPWWLTVNASMSCNHFSCKPLGSQRSTLTLQHGSRLRDQRERGKSPTEKPVAQVLGAKYQYARAMPLRTRSWIPFWHIFRDSRSYT